MKVRMDKGTLVQVLQKVQSITEKKSNMPVLSNILLKTTEQSTLELLATDLELSAWTTVAAGIDHPGGVTVNARKFFEIIKELPLDQIVLEELPGNRLLIHSGRAHFELSTIPMEDFPHMSFYQEAVLEDCDPELLRRALNRTLHGIPTEDDPFSISGLFLHPVANLEIESGNNPTDAGVVPDFRFVSSDGHRLAYYQVPGTSFPGVNVGNGIVVPRKGIQEVLRLTERESEVALGTYENCLLLRTSNTLLSVQLLETEFPEYQLIIPEERPFSFLVNREDFYLALKRVSVLTNQKWRHVRFLISNGLLELEAGDPEVGSAKDGVDIEYEGEGFSVAFNIRYVMDAVQAVESSRIRFEWLDSYHGGIFLGPDDPGYFGLIMPMVV